MTILVTGGAGYIGSHMAHALADAGRKVIVLDDLSTGARENIPSKAQFVQGDVNDEILVRSLLRAHKITSIIHFAAKIVVPDSVADPLGYYLANTVKTRSLVASAVAEGVKNFIFSSTAAVYGNPSTPTVLETSPTAPMSPYGTSKLMSEWMLRDTALAHDLRYIVLRYFNVAGADPHGRTGQSTPNATHLIKVAVQAALGLRPGMELFGNTYPTRDGTCMRDYIHVSDLVAAHAKALEYLEAGGQSHILNCGYGDGFTVSEVIETVKRVTKSSFPVTLSPPRAGDPASIVADAAQIRTILDWQPQWNNLETIIEHAWLWEKHLINRGQAA